MTMAPPRSAADPGPLGPTERSVEVPLPNGAVLRRRYDLAGRLRLEERPDGTWLRHRYDADGNPRSVEHSSGARVDYAVLDEGRTWRATTRGPAATTVETTLGLDHDGMPVTVEQVVEGVRVDLTYVRDERGQVQGWLYPGAASWLRLDPAGPGRLTLRAGATTYAELVGTDDRRSATLRWSTGATTIEHLTADPVATAAAGRGARRRRRGPAPVRPPRRRSGGGPRR